MSGAEHSDRSEKLPTAPDSYRHSGESVTTVRTRLLEAGVEVA
jgi:hypothetical protein